VLLALSRIQYDGTRNTLHFDPKQDLLPFSSFWSTGNGWGTVEINADALKIDVAWGELPLNQLSLGNAILFKSKKTAYLKAGSSRSFSIK